MNEKQPPTPLETTLKEYLRQYSPNQTIAVALSGGIDSLLLCEGLLKAKADIIALHFNHRWRGTQSDLDEKWVTQWCRKKGIIIQIGRAKQKGPTSENTARQERWNFFTQVTHEQNIHQIWLAHHADDVVETFLMQLMRGAGPRGLTGIRNIHQIGKLQIIRPLTTFFKHELETQAKHWKLKWRKDHTNTNTQYLRNRIRLQTLPLLSQTIGRDIKKTLLRTATLLTDENDYWNKKIPSPPPERLHVANLKKKHPAEQRRIIHHWLESRNVTNIDYPDIESVRHLLTHLKPSKINLSHNLFCRRKQGYLFIE